MQTAIAAATLTEWGVVGVLATLCALVAAIVTPIVRLNSTVVKVTEIVTRCAADLDKLTTRNSDTHDRLFKRLEDDEKVVSNHETRITVLEKGAKQ